MHKGIKRLLLVATHIAALVFGVGLGIYLLPILTAPDSPATEVVQATAARATFTGEFIRELEDSDALHWGEGQVFIGRDNIAFQGKLAPGPDYRLYLSPEFVETEADFVAKKPLMTAVIVWCESFGQFITAATYR